MNLPFTSAQFFDVLAEYNVTTWPAPIVWTIAAVLGVGTSFIRRWDRMLGWLLAALWAWMAVAYQLAFFTRINPAAWWFGAAFLLAAGVFVRHAYAGRTLRFGQSVTATRAIGLALIAYALVAYPLLAFAAGQVYPRVPTFGLPCPTTIFTLGCLLLAEAPVPASLFVVPMVWSVVGTVAAMKLGVVEDYGLPVAAVLSLAFTLRRSLPHPIRPRHTAIRER